MRSLALTCLLFVALFTQGCHASAELKPTKAGLPRLIRSKSAPVILTNQPDKPVPEKPLPPPKCPLFDVIEKCIAAGKTKVYISMGAMGDDTKSEPEEYHADPVILAQTRGTVVSPLPNCIVYSGTVYPKTRESLTAYCQKYQFKCFGEYVTISSDELKKCCGKTLSAPVTVVFGDFTYGAASKLYDSLIKYATSSTNVVQGYTYGFSGPGNVWKYGGTIGTKTNPPTVQPTKFSEALPVCKLVEGDTADDDRAIEVTYKMAQVKVIPDMKMNTPAQELWDYLREHSIVGPKVRLIFKGKPVVMEKTLGGNGFQPGVKNVVNGIEMFGH